MPAFSSDERQLLHESLTDYFQTKYPFERFRELSDPEHPDGHGREEWLNYAELGWLGVAMGDDAGGSAGGMTELAIVMAAAGGALAMEPLMQTVVLSAAAIEAAGSADQRAVLSRVASGETVLAFCHSEPDAGYARRHVETLAQPTPEGFRLRGTKSFTLHAHVADHLVVSARLGNDSGPIGLFLISAESDGIHRRIAPALDGRRGAIVSLSDVRVPRDALLGDEEADRSDLIDQLLDRGAIATCAEAAGAMSAVTEQTVEYLKTRQQFGQPLSKFQVLQHRLVDMSVKTEEARAATHSALTALDQRDPNAQTKIWQAKVQTGQSAHYVGSQAIQLHGGMGMTDELSVGHYYKRLSLCESAFGDAAWYLRQLAARS
ncbi:MAG: acyl-CoA dehydrogenase family protein [Pseudomonadota bacterium]